MSQTATVYFIDDSATMREVIKIAFRRENLNVVACPSADAAIAQMDQVPPDVVITDVIMPEKDGYEVCQHIKQHPRFAKVPVVLMSGVVNRAVAEKAFAVKADELIRKPFQPQDLITRVRHLLQPKAAVPPQAAVAAAANASAALSSIFQAPAATQRASAQPSAPFTAVAATPPRVAAPAVQPAAAPVAPPAAPVAATPPRPPMPQRPTAAPGVPADVQKLRVEVLRLEGLVRKLQSELEAEREYSRALEEHVKTLQDAE